jgi:hypothetical protein
VTSARNGTPAERADLDAVALDRCHGSVKVRDLQGEVLTRRPGKWRGTVSENEVQLARTKLEPCPVDFEVWTIDLAEPHDVNVEVPGGGQVIDQRAMWWTLTIGADTMPSWQTFDEPNLFRPQSAQMSMRRPQGSSPRGAGRDSIPRLCDVSGVSL